ncbi:hypothetical protein DXH95_15720 [Sphingorhabdus pulchriflava]|uniref:Uncharacterized protein n=1 Tax=Sphingorhabdus pulchriflava TaxID=2292257 RepID=A0A371B2I5_9SPHN|nr:hypothetical protein DXH95_15720 [Sphingorhabdus pulchriflava]
MSPNIQFVFERRLLGKSIGIVATCHPYYDRHVGLQPVAVWRAGLPLVVLQAQVPIVLVVLPLSRFLVLQRL